MPLEHVEFMRRKKAIESSCSYKEAADKLCISYSSVLQFARRNHVKLKKSPDKPYLERLKTQAMVGVAMESALDDYGQRVCKRFFAALELARKRGYEINVVDAMSCWNKLAREGKLDL